MSGIGWRLVMIPVAVAGLLATTAGACDPTARPERNPVPKSTGPTERPGPVTGPPGTRHNNLDVPPSFRARTIDFTDSDTGYLLFANCAPRCNGVLFVTFDSGQSWLERKVPVTDADDLQMEAVDAERVVLMAGSSGWFVSSDTGRTFTPGGTGPPDLSLIRRGVQSSCPTLGQCPAQVLRDGKPVAAQPGLPGELRGAAASGDGPLWAVSTKDSTVYTATSADGGRTWKPFGQPRTLPGVALIELRVSLDGQDVWLVTDVGAGRIAVFAAEGMAWREITTNLGVGSSRVTVAAAGKGALAIGGADFGYLHRNGSWLPQATPRLVPSLYTLPDGALVVMIAADDVWLGTGEGTDRAWAHITVDAI